MSEQTGLAAKVIKHWFRNTLFKERQRNKDSPYNFSVPPTTNLNLEEYEKTGNWKNLTDAERKSPSAAVATVAGVASCSPHCMHVVITLVCS